MSDWQRDKDTLLGYYDRLRGRDPDLEAELGAALNSLDLVAALVRARRALEVIVIALCTAELHRERGTEPLAGVLGKLARDCPGLVPDGVLAAMEYLNKLGNLGAHPKPVSGHEVGLAFAALASVVRWYLLDYKQDFGTPTPAAAADAPTPPTALAPNPYVGLDSFEEKDAGRFYGREGLIDDTLWPAFARLAADPTRLLALLGPSGCGKSSVARAGLLPRIKAEWPCQVLTLTPTHRPLDALADALARHALPADPAPAAKAQEFRDLLAAGDGGLTRIAGLLGQRGQGPLILLLDQAEEVFTLCRAPDDQARLLGNLIAAIQDPAPHLYLLLTLRSDFLGETQRFPAFNALLASHGQLLPVLDGAGLRRAIAEPARRAGHPFDDGLVAHLADAADGRDGALPLLQYALTEVWRGLAVGTPPAETLRRCNGVGGALAGRAEVLYAALPAAEQARVRRCLPRLVQPGEGVPDTRRRVPLDDLLAEGEDPAALHATLRRFAAPDARFLTLGRAGDGRVQVEIAHDALIAHWGRLREWLAADRDDLRLLTRLDGAAQHWADQREATGLLWRRPDLDLLARYAGRPAVQLTPLQGRFWRAARARARRERLARVAGLLLLVGLTVTASAAAWWARQAEQRAEQQRALAAAQKDLALNMIANRTYQAVDGLEKLAGTSRITGDLIQGNLDLLERLVALNPADADTRHHQAANLQRALDAWLRLGDTDRATASGRRMLEVTEAQAAADPDNSDWQRGLYVSYERLGDLALALGDTAAARGRYEQALTIGERLAAADPDNSDWQQDLVVSYVKLGDLAQALGDTAAARGRYEQTLAIGERLAAADPDNSGWQRDLSISYNKLGDLALALGDTAAARGRYEQALTIAERLAAADPDNSEWQRDLSVSLSRLGDLALALGDTAAARGRYEQTLTIGERLAAADPDNSDWQRDLSVSYNKLGDLALALGDTAAARGRYEQDLAIAERLAAADPDNSDWQRDLSVSYNKLGDLALALGDTAAARGRYEQTLAIRERLAAADPDNSAWQRDLSVSYNKLGNLALALGDTAAARGRYEQTLAIRERLAAADPDNSDWQRDLSVSYNKLGDLAMALGDTATARGRYEQALAIAERLAAADPDNSDWQRDLAVSHYKLGRLALETDAPAEALPHAEQAVAITERLTALDPANAQWRQDRVAALRLRGQVQDALGQPARAIAE